ncbi:Maltose excess protein 1-like [Nymphaea thermarum]|nr:Maltose excess protein 1-like [Nymphaea thermarum]
MRPGLLNRWQPAKARRVHLEDGSSTVLQGIRTQHLSTADSTFKPGFPIVQSTSLWPSLPGSGGLRLFRPQTARCARSHYQASLGSMEAAAVPLALSPRRPFNAALVKPFSSASLTARRRPPPHSLRVLLGFRLLSGVSRPTFCCRINASSDSGSSFLDHSSSKEEKEGKEMGPGRSGRSYKEEESVRWDALTAKFAGAANVPFLLLQLPQIVLNSRNLMAGNARALFALPWIVSSLTFFLFLSLRVSSYGSLTMLLVAQQKVYGLQGMLTGLLGNLCLVSYFAKKKETEAVLVQTLGVLSTYVVIVQLALAEAMPLPTLIATSAIVACGMFLNFLYYFRLLPPFIWRCWEDFITIGGLSVLPQVMWSTFVPYIPQSILPGAVAFSVAVIAVIMERTGKLSDAGASFVSSISGWTATLLFMWMPVAQMWTNYLNPDNIRGLSAFSMLLSMVGNGLMIPRALFIGDLMWFTGCTWASVLYGWGNLICMYCFKSISWKLFYAATLGLITWIGVTFWRDTKVYGYSSPALSLRDLISGRRIRGNEISLQSTADATQ